MIPDINKMKFVEMGIFKGRVLSKVTVSEDKETITFICDDQAKIVMSHDQDCCECVWVDDICGDLSDLLGTPVLMSEESSTPDEDRFSGGASDGETWTFYKLGTKKGSVTIRWCGASNGYYSESVDIHIYDPEDRS